MSNEIQTISEEKRYHERAANELFARERDLELKLKIRDSEIERLEFALQSERDCVLRLQRQLNRLNGVA